MKIAIKKISSKQSYTIQELAKTLKTSRKTVDKWINNEGLKVYGDKPVLIFGSEFIEFAKLRNIKAKPKQGCFDSHGGDHQTAYCMRCRTINHIMVNDMQQPNNPSIIVLYGKCCKCQLRISKFAKAAMATYWQDRLNPPVRNDSNEAKPKPLAKNHSNQPKQGDLFDQFSCSAYEQ